MSTHDCPHALLLPALRPDSDPVEVAASLKPIEDCMRRGEAPLFDSGSFRRVAGPDLERPVTPKPLARIRRL